MNIARFLCDFKLDFFLSNINGYIFTESQVVSQVLLICFQCDLKLDSFCSLILMATDCKFYLQILFRPANSAEIIDRYPTAEIPFILVSDIRKAQSWCEINERLRRFWLTEIIDRQPLLCGVTSLFFLGFCSLTFDDYMSQCSSQPFSYCSNHRTLLPPQIML